jgi:tellurite resistance protein TerC
MPSAAAIIEALPIIFSLIVIEGLLSVDNALAIAALASHLPEKQQQLALKLGIIGAYAFRGLALLCVSLIIDNPWLKILGSAYLVWLMASNIVSKEESPDVAKAHHHRPGLVGTIFQIEVMDLTLSLDNVVAAVALDKRLWVICTGVFIGILALRFLAGMCIGLIKKFPVLEKTAFLLIGFVGCILLTEMSLASAGVHFHINSYQKFGGILVIIALSLGYERSATLRAVLNPLLQLGKPILALIDKAVLMLFWPLWKTIALLKGHFFSKAA